MNIHWKNKFYEMVAAEVKTAMAEKNLTVYGLAKEVSEQRNTITRIRSGKGFGFHNIVWMIAELQIDMTDLIFRANQITTIGDIDSQETVSEDFNIFAEDLIYGEEKQKEEISADDLI